VKPQSTTRTPLHVEDRSFLATLRGLFSAKGLVRRRVGMSCRAVDALRPVCARCWRSACFFGERRHSAQPTFPNTAPFSIPSSLPLSDGVRRRPGTGECLCRDSKPDVVHVFGAEGGAPAGGAPAQIQRA